MPRPLSFHAAVVLAALLLATPARALSPSEFFTRVSPSIWLVRTYDKDGLALASGSAVVIAPETLITNCHVLRKAKSFHVIHEGRTLPGTLALWDPPRDLCEIKAAGLDAPAVEIGDSARVMVGQSIYTLGAPRGLELTLSNGLVSALRHNAQQQLTDIQISAPISHGSSGGGLFDTDGRLIGITSSVYDDAQNLNFALPSAWISELPARHLAAQKRAPQQVAAADAGSTAPPAVPPAASAPPPQRPESPPTARATPADPSGIPFLNDASQRLYRDLLAKSSYPRACAISDNGHFACSWGTRQGDPNQRALDSCANYAGRACMLYLVNDTVVYTSPSP